MCTLCLFTQLGILVRVVPWSVSSRVTNRLMSDYDRHLAFYVAFVLSDRLLNAF